MPWYVIYTKPRNEKKVAEALLKVGIEAYCPVIIEERKWSDRKKKVETPLIPSYVFVNVEEKDRDKVFVVSGIVRYLYWLGKPAIITEAEISRLKESLNRKIQKYEVQQYSSGDKITIPSGVFKGKEAEITEFRGQKMNLILSNIGIRIVLYIEDLD